MRFHFFITRNLFVPVDKGRYAPEEHDSGGEKRQPQRNHLRARVAVFCGQGLQVPLHLRRGSVTVLDIVGHGFGNYFRQRIRHMARR